MSLEPAGGAEKERVERSSFAHPRGAIPLLAAGRPGGQRSHWRARPEAGGGLWECSSLRVGECDAGKSLYFPSEEGGNSSIAEPPGKAVFVPTGVTQRT